MLALSGHVPRTVDSIPSVRSLKVASASLTESQVPITDPQVWAVAASTPDHGEVAFAMQMQAMPAREGSVSGESRGRMTAAEESRPTPITTAERDVSVVEPVAASENHPTLSSEPEQAPTLHMAIRAGKPVDAPAGGIAADSLAPRRVGELMLPIAQEHVERVVLVNDAAIRRAQAALWSTLRVVAEPGGATAFAALLSGQYRPRPHERVAVLICGANTTAVNFEG